MLLMVEKCISGGTWDAINQYVKANNRHINNLYGWAMSQTLPISGFKWVENTFQFSKDFIQNSMKIVIKVIFSKLAFNILKNYMTFTMIYYYCLKEWKLKKLKNMKPICMIQNNMPYTYKFNALNCGLEFKKVHRVIEFNQKAGLIP